MRERQHVRFCRSSDGVSIAYATLGSGPPLVKAPNWLSHLEYEWQSPIWRHWLEGLSRHNTFIRYDARGCGLSDRDPPEITFESWVRDLEAVADAARLDRFPLLGISAGGAVAIAYAARHPERVSHLLLYGTFARMARRAGPEAAEEATLMCKLIELGWGRRNRAFRQVFATRFLPEASAELFDAFDDLQRESSSGGNALRMLQVALEVDVVKEARTIRCPTLVMHATDDGIAPFEVGRILASLIPESRFVPLESRNHILLDGEPAWHRFLEEMQGFLRREAGGVAFTALTPREREMVELLARGLDNHQIAAHLDLSEKTVRNMVCGVLTKLGAGSRSQAIVRAREAGFGVGVHG
jgi:pimeloyl-ACP methyl ester carboxylesterase/DNA-binding CsgD family transcriptional regulator